MDIRLKVHVCIIDVIWDHVNLLTYPLGHKATMSLLHR